jgi:DNA-binding NarL/FixJ family response regulator
VRAVLAGEPDVEIVGEAIDGATCMTAIALTDPDVLVLDLHMPGGDGFHVLAGLEDLLVAPRVLVLSADRGADARARVSAAGAEFLHKGAPAGELTAAVRRLAA